MGANLVQKIHKTRSQIEGLSKIPQVNEVFYLEDEDKFYQFNGKSWVEKPPIVGDIKANSKGTFVYGNNGWFQYRDPKNVVLDTLTKVISYMSGIEDFDKDQLTQEVFEVITIIDGLDFYKASGGV